MYIAITLFTQCHVVDLYTTTAAAIPGGYFQEGIYFIQCMHWWVYSRRYSSLLDAGQNITASMYHVRFSSYHFYKEEDCIAPTKTCLELSGTQMLQTHISNRKKEIA